MDVAVLGPGRPGVLQKVECHISVHSMTLSCLKLALGGLGSPKPFRFYSSGVRFPLSHVSTPSRLHTQTPAR